MKFLLVDDQEEINLLMKKILSPYGECTVAMDGETAIQVFSDAVSGGAPFSAVFLDIKMPGMDGHEVADRLRKVEKDQLESGPKFKLMMITALSDTANVCKSFFRGGKADAYITKPIRKEKIIEELKFLKVIDS